MANNIVLFSDHSNGITPVLNRLLGDIGSLLNIKGYFLKYDERQYHYYQLKSRDHFLTVFKDISLYSIEEIVQIEVKLLNEISLFPNPDLYIIDGVGKLECQSDRFCRQIMMLFESRIPVVIGLKGEQHPAFQKIEEIAPFLFIDIKDINQPETYTKLLNFID